MPKFRLGDVGNTYNPCLNIIRDMGVSLGLELFEREPSTVGEELGYWWARRSDVEFSAVNPVALLGLIALWEARGESWRRDSDEDLHAWLREGAIRQEEPS